MVLNRVYDFIDFWLLAKKRFGGFVYVLFPSVSLRNRGAVQT